MGARPGRPGECMPHKCPILRAPNRNRTRNIHFTRVALFQIELWRQENGVAGQPQVMTPVASGQRPPRISGLIAHVAYPLLGAVMITDLDKNRDFTGHAGSVFRSLFFVEPDGFEPTTFCLQNRRSTKLS